MDESIELNEVIERPQAPQRAPRLFRNLTSLAGAAIMIASLVSILFLFFAEMMGEHDKPYLGMFTYIIFPSFLILGLSVFLIGMLMERRRRRRMAPDEVAAYPRIDLNDPRKRRQFFTFLGLTFIFLFVSAFGSYRAYEYTDSVAFCGQLCHGPMNPEFVAYQNSPHARVRCVDCHVGPGAGWYVRSKLSGAYKVYAVLFNKYPRPIPTPVHNLRPAQDTCEQCHWPEKFFGAQLKTFNHYSYDEANTLRQTRMLINTGGGSPEKGLVTGIHWHMNIANEITYISTDEHRQVIPWVRMKDRYGNITEYKAIGSDISPDQVESGAIRRMDCVDCHNRPSHIYVPPDRAVDEAFLAQRMDQSLPFLKRQAVAALSGDYSTTDEAVAAIASSLDEFYRANYPEVYNSRRDSINAAIAELQRIFRTYFFPEMKVSWQTHPDNIGHFYFQGCFRCHDGKHVSTSDPTKIIRTDCNICHTVLDEKEGGTPTEGGTPIAVQNGNFQHFVVFGEEHKKFQCNYCHSGAGIPAKTFQHPAKQIDITGQTCTSCHVSRGQ